MTRWPAGATGILLVVLVVLVGGGCSFLLPPQLERQRQIARGLEPEALETAAAATKSAAPERVLRLRAYVDESYAALDPEARARTTVADASAILVAQARVGLELVEVRPWPDAATDLHEALGELERRDPLRDAGDSSGVDLVVGFIGASPTVTDQLHLLGVAKLLGRHLVSRGMNDAREAAAIDAMLTLVPDGQRGALVERRRRHKAAVVLLHEVAHALGGVHVDDPETVLFPSYTIEQTRLNDDALALIEEGLAYHAAVDDSGRKEATRRLREQVERRRARLDPKSVDDTLAFLDEKSAIASGAFVLPPEQARVFNEALAAWRRGDTAAAFALARGLARADDAHPRSIVLACSLASADGVVAMDGASLCERAVQKAPTLDAALAALRVAIKSNGDVAAGFALARERAKGATGTTAAAGATVDQRVELGALAWETRRLAVIEEVLLNVDDARAAKLRDEVRLRRGRLGLPAGKLDVEEELALQDALSATYAAMEDPKRAASVLAENERRFGEVPGLLCARCDLLRLGRRFKDAERACARALELMPEASIAHLVAALIDADKGKRAQAIARLEKAHALDPEYAPTNELLAKMRAR